jgi:hypothetical protein
MPMVELPYGSRFWFWHLRIAWWFLLGIADGYEG